MELIMLPFVFAFGLIIGSFANVCIYRMPRNLSIIRPRSHCTSCNLAISPFDNIPLLSFLILGGKCRSCGEKIGWRYPMIELASGLLYVLAFLLIIKSPEDIYHFFVAAYLSTVFLIIFFIDFDFRIIPDSISLSGIVIGFLVSFLPAMPIRPLDSFIGLVIGGLLFLAIAELGDRVFKKESMGGGDIKLAAMLGAFVGWKNILLVLVIASLLGTIIGLAAIALAKDKESAHTVPFGPFLVTAGLITYYWGQLIIAKYMSLVGL
jgi:leader peptidase (prepilin peptidase) / N-methyltransferase